jgi:multidrug efflux system outer membrane protein
MRSTLTVAVLAALLTGCSGMLAPSYQRPASPVPASWPVGPAYGNAAQADASQIADMGWREFIVDAKLQKLVETALSNNRDLRISALKIEKARAQYGIARADLFPSISASVAGNHVQTARDLTSPSSARVTHTYTAGVGFSAYELDFFGRVQNLKDQALETYLQTEEARNSAQITLVAEVANAYLTLAADQELLRLAQQTLDSQQASYKLNQRRFAVGVSSQLDLSQAQTTVDTARVAVATSTAQVAQDVNALQVLIGTSVPDDLMPSGPVESVAVFKALPVGLSSDVLLRRPDLRADEHVLKADNASIGAARAAFFPSISLTATRGTGSNDLRRLFRSGNGTWSFIPQLNLPIFEGGALTSALDEAKATHAIDLAQYEKDIQTAFKEVSNALADHGTLGQKLEAQQSLTNATALSFRLSDARYKNGIASYLDVLDAQRSLFTAQQNLIAVKLSQQANLVTLYKVLGGGMYETHNTATSE